MPSIMIWRPNDNNLYGHAAISTSKYYMSFWPQNRIKPEKVKVFSADTFWGGVVASIIIHPKRDIELEGHTPSKVYDLEDIFDSEVNQVYEHFLRFNGVDPATVSKRYQQKQFKKLVKRQNNLIKQIRDDIKQHQNLASKTKLFNKIFDEFIGCHGIDQSTISKVESLKLQLQLVDWINLIEKSTKNNFNIRLDQFGPPKLEMEAPLSKTKYVYRPKLLSSKRPMSETDVFRGHSWTAESCTSFCYHLIELANIFETEMSLVHTNPWLIPRVIPSITNMIDLNTFTIERFEYAIKDRHEDYEHNGCPSPLSVQVGIFYLNYAISIYMMGIILGLFYIFVIYWIIFILFGEENEGSLVLGEFEPPLLLTSFVMLIDWVATVHFLGKPYWFKVLMYLMGSVFAILYLFVVLEWYICTDDGCPTWIYFHPSPWLLIVTIIFLVPYLTIFTSYLMKKPKRYNYDPVKLNWSAFRIHMIVDSFYLTLILPFMFLFLRIAPASYWYEHRFVMH